MSHVLCWGHNPGQRYVKDSFSVGDKRKDTRPYPAVIAPWQKSDDTGLAKRGRELTARLGDAMYLGGDAAERMPIANRQMANGRLDAASPVYQAFAQMSVQHTGILKTGERPTVLIATALPVGWRDESAEQAITAHVRAGLKGLVAIKDIYVQSEPNAVVSSELLDDDGNMRRDQAELATGLVCVGDIGGGTLNRSVLDGLKALAGQSASPLLGSRQVVEALMQMSGQQYIDAERRMETAVRLPGQDAPADALLRQYREAVVGTFQQAWGIFKPVVYLFAGGTVHWVEGELRRAFPRARIVANPQQAIAIGLWRYARRKAARGA